MKFLKDLSKLINQIEFKQLDIYLEKLKKIQDEFRRMMEPLLIKIKWHETKHIVWISSIVIALIYLNASPPFQAIASSSMEPTLSVGDLVFIKKVQTASIQEGDVIVYRVPKIFQERYGYPETICHRVIDVHKSDGMVSFRTKGDATGQDPFMIETGNVIGEQFVTVPLVGYLVMYPQSRQGLIFIVGAIILYVCYIKSDYLSFKSKTWREKYKFLSSSEFHTSQKHVEDKIVDMNKKVANSLDSFAAAMSEYAEHIASHTTAVQSLARAAQQLEQVVAIRDVQTRVIPGYREPGGIRQNSGKPVEENRIPIAITPELKAALLEFLRDYARQNNLVSIELTPAIREAAWKFITRYAALHPQDLTQTLGLSPKSEHKDPSSIIQM